MMPSRGAINTGWRRHIGCLKLQVVFRERATDYRALLREMTYEDKASYDSTPPCVCVRSKVSCTQNSSICRSLYLSNTDLGWLRFVGSLKSWAFFAEYSIFCRAFLQKRPVILRSLLIVATP